MTNSTMTNIIYSYFLQNYFSKNVNLEEQSYKIALFNGSYTPNLSRVETYEALSGAGLECVDGNSLISDNPNKGYKKGGIPISFKKEKEEPLDTSEADISWKRYSRYSCDNVTFKKVTLTGDNRPCWAIIYREDGLLVCCFPLQIEDINNEDLELSWEDTFVIEISANTIEVDTKIDSLSSNPVQNKVIAEALGARDSNLERALRSLEKYGVRLNDESDDGNPDTDDENIDTLNRINDDTIDEMFED